MLYQEFEGKVVVVTGAGSGIGRAVATRLAKFGAYIAAVDISEERLEALKSEIEADGGKVMTIAANAAKQDEYTAVIDKALEIDGTIYGLANCCGIPDRYRKFADTKDEEWEACLNVNLNGTFWICRRACQVMKEQGYGTIVNVSSDCGLFGGRAGAPYTATKWAIVGISKNIAYMHGRDGIRCNCVCPGGVNTAFNDTFEQWDKEGLALIKLGSPTSIRRGEAQETADVIIFCLSEEARFVNGVALPADAGWSAY